MNITAKKGNYKGLTIDDEHKVAQFTFHCHEDSDAALVLYDKKNGDEIYRFSFPKSYRMGELCSVCIEGIDWMQTTYAFFENGVQTEDAYALRVIGREQFAPSLAETKKRLIRSGFETIAIDDQRDFFVRIPEAQRVIYKLHVRNFSVEKKESKQEKNDKIGKKKKTKGTFAGIADAIPYYQSLGINTIELMPVYDFDEWDYEEPKSKVAHVNYENWKKLHLSTQDNATQTMTGHKNCWGYKKGCYFAPKASFASGENASDEFLHMVRALHKSGIAVILEFFFPVGLDTYYVIEVLRHWVKQYHIDGIHLLGDGVPLSAVVNDPFLSKTDLYASGFYPEHLKDEDSKTRLYVYNDEFLYAARKMMTGLERDMYEFTRHFTNTHPSQGFVHYVTNNNGFTMWDLFSYNCKHNEENGWDNADGSDYNYSMNCGEEGVSRKKTVLLKRRRMMRAAFATLFLQSGIPLLYAGDEFENSQKGNNNAYCIDNSISHLNWERASRAGQTTEFVRKMIAFKKEHPILSMGEKCEEIKRVESGLPRISYHAQNAWIPGFDSARSAIGILYCGEYAVKSDGTPDDMLYLAFNFGQTSEKLAMPIPKSGFLWKKVIDTSKEESFLTEEKELEETHAMILPESVCVFIAKRKLSLLSNAQSAIIRKDLREDK